MFLRDRFLLFITEQDKIIQSDKKEDEPGRFHTTNTAGLTLFFSFLLFVYSSTILPPVSLKFPAKVQ